MACICESNNTVRSCAPYANVDDVNDLISKICATCTATVPPGTPTSSFCSLAFSGAIDECCNSLTVFEGSNIWFSNDCTNWSLVTTQAGFYVGDLKPSARSSDFGTSWLLADGRTLGNATFSGADFADDTMQSLFVHLWDEFANTELPILDSAGAGSTRGVSGVADWNANKRMPMPDIRGRTLVGKDDPGNGTGAALVVTDTEADALGGSMGAETHTLTENEMPAHTHSARHSPLATSGTANLSSGPYSQPNVTGVTGGDDAHNNMQPSLFINYYIYTGN